MLRRFASHFDDMALAIALWMCTLPLIGLVVLPFFGQKVSLLAAAGLLISILVICRAFAPGEYLIHEVSI